MDNFPEKILLVQDDDMIKDYWVLENLTDCKDMEYIRKDVFINKACEWLKENSGYYVEHWDGDTWINSKLYEDCRKAMMEK